MKFSVLMSVYQKDNPEHLKLALKSIYEDQTKKPDEIVVIFDGPLGNELTAVLNDFLKDKSDIVHYYPQAQNRGLGGALQIGMEKCTGDYLFRMDADDISLPSRFEKQSAYLEEHPDIDVLGTDTAEFHSSPTEENMRICSFPQEHGAIVRLATKRNPINHMTVCIKREALLNCGGYQPLPFLEDYYLWLRMIAAGYHFANLNEVLVNVRIGNGFYQRRSASAQVKGWRTLQDYMIDRGMITRLGYARNMLTVRVFVIIPPWLKNGYMLFFFERKNEMLSVESQEKGIE